VGEKLFHCHRLVLALKSPYFDEKLFTSSSSSAGDEQIVLNDIRADDFDKVLQFIYTGETTLNEENIENILGAANIMELTELTKLCVEYLSDRLSLKTCPHYWALAEHVNVPALA